MNESNQRREIRAALRANPERARRLVRAYARQANRTGDPVRKAESQLFAAELDFLQGRLRPAAAAYSKARDAFARLGEKSRMLAAELGALQAHAILGEGTRTHARVKTVRALAADSLQAALVENAIGTALDALGEDRAAEGAFRKALEHLKGRRAATALIARGTARCNLGVRLARRGAVAAALRELDAALELFARLEMPDWCAIVRHNRGWARGLAGRSAEALEDLAAARAAYDERGDALGAGLARLDEAEFVLRLGDAPRALDVARAAARTLDGAGAAIEAARARLVAARGHALAGNAGAARRVARRARAAFQRAGDRAGRAQADLLLGADLVRAERDLHGAGHWIGALDALLARARASTPAAGARLLRRRAGDYPPALRRWVLPDLYRLQATGPPVQRIAMLRRAYRAAEALRRVAPTGALRASALAAHLGIYEELAAALLERGRARDRREAFLVLDAVRARTLREEMEREAPGITEAPQVRALRARLEALWRSLERRDGEAGDLRRAEVALLREVSRCEREFVGALARAEAAAPGIERTAEVPRGACLAVSVVRGEAVALLGRDGNVDAWGCGPLATIRSDLDAFRFQVNRRLHGATDREPAVALLERLARRLFSGFDPDAAGDRLFVVLPPELGSLPVEALPVRGGILLERTAVTYLPYACARGTGWRRSGRSLLVGIESARLPEVAKELAFVEGRIGRARALLGDDATRARILRELEGRRLIHLAGHARAREDLPLLSALKVRDGWITAADLGGLSLDGALVVLSACRTGDPSLRWLGEALAGFPRALLAAGAAGLLASRWEVPDATAHAWMRNFYDAVRNERPDRAAARAALAIRDSHPHPADWAAFLLVRSGTTLGERVRCARS